MMQRFTVVAKPVGGFGGVFARAFSSSVVAMSSAITTPHPSILDIETPRKPTIASVSPTNLATTRFDHAMRLANQGNLRAKDAVATHKEIMDRKVSEDYLRQMPRPWKKGDVYAPKDMSFSELAKWRKGRKKNADIIDLLGIDPMNQYANPTFIADFTTSFGQIQHSKLTGLRPVNQRKVAKAIRRAIGMGLHPSVHRHPEILRAEFALKKNRG